MDELTDLITKLGNKTLKGLPDIFSNGWSLPLKSSLKDQVRSGISLQKFSEINKLFIQIQRKNKEHINNYSTSLAAKIPNHDLKNFLYGLNINVDFLINRVGKSEYATRNFKEGTLVEEILDDIMPYRSFCLSMTYLASNGNMKFTSSIPVKQIKHFLKTSSNYKMDFKTGKNDSNSILTPEYIALLQIVKNAPTLPTVCYGVKEDLTFIQVEDSGPGFRDKDGNFLPPERLPEIFGNFSTRKKGGLGLQVAKELVHLRGGYLTVETKTEGELTISYNTKTNKVIEGLPKREGTKFEIYTPLVQ
jgi:light-regulated signal transduction histidine kinase (bacteriophytochrome)